MGPAGNLFQESIHLQSMLRSSTCLTWLPPSGVGSAAQTAQLKNAKVAAARIPLRANPFAFIEMIAPVMTSAVNAKNPAFSLARILCSRMRRYGPNGVVTVSYCFYWASSRRPAADQCALRPGYPRLTKLAQRD